MNLRYLVSVSALYVACRHGVCGPGSEGYTFRSLFCPVVFAWLLATPWSEEHPAPHLDTMKRWLNPSTPKQPASPSPPSPYEARR